MYTFFIPDKTLVGHHVSDLIVGHRKKIIIVIINALKYDLKKVV